MGIGHGVPAEPLLCGEGDSIVDRNDHGLPPVVNLCAPLRPSVVHPFPSPPRPRLDVFHAMENPADAGQAFFHTVENPDFRKGFRPRLLSCRGRGPGGRVSA